VGARALRDGFVGCEVRDDRGVSDQPLALVRDEERDDVAACAPAQVDSVAPVDGHLVADVVDA
jgi:hypothetical protein